MLWTTGPKVKWVETAENLLGLKLPTTVLDVHRI